MFLSVSKYRFCLTDKKRQLFAARFAGVFLLACDCERVVAMEFFWYITSIFGFTVLIWFLLVRKYLNEKIYFTTRFHKFILILTVFL